MTGRRVLRVLVVVVLAVSLLANAVVAGALIRIGGGEPAARAMLAGFVVEMPREIRRPFVRALRQDRRALRPLRRELRGARSELIAAIRAEPYDRARAEAAMARVRAATDRLQNAAQAVLLDTLDRRHDGRSGARPER